MWDPLRPLNKREELFVSCLTDVSHRVIWLREMGGKSYGRFGSTLGTPLVRDFDTPSYNVVYLFKPHVNRPL